MGNLSASATFGTSSSPYPAAIFYCALADEVLQRLWLTESWARVAAALAVLLARACISFGSCRKRSEELRCAARCEPLYIFSAHKWDSFAAAALGWFSQLITIWSFRRKTAWWCSAFFHRDRLETEFMISWKNSRRRDFDPRVLACVRAEFLYALSIRQPQKPAN